jgi:ABC-type nitrate/sulfonate/bicarbonate transport system ATPase subunit/ABC-type nitrate/sulfonate/bicarbonate transport system permease component
MVNVEHLGFSYRLDKKNLPVLRDVDASFAKGEITAIVGPSGCGKTTLLRLMAGLSFPSTGTISMNGHLVESIQPDTSIIFQDYGLLPWQTVRSNAELGLRIRHAPGPIRRSRVDPILEELGLRQFSTLYPLRLSGGMRQRVAVARALAQESDLLLMDEPFSSLDAMTRESLQDSLLDIQRRHETTIVIVTHSIEEAAYLADKVYIMRGRNPGTIVDCVTTGRRSAGNASSEFKNFHTQDVATRSTARSDYQSASSFDTQDELPYRLEPRYQETVAVLRRKFFSPSAKEERKSGSEGENTIEQAVEAKGFGKFSVNSNAGRMVRILGTAAVLLTLWGILSLLAHKAFLPSPQAAFSRVFQNVGNGNLLYHTAVSLKRIIEALVIAGPLAWILGLAAGRSKSLDSFFSPVMYLLHPTPKVAFLPILLLFLGLGDASKIALIGLVIFGQLYVGARDSSRTLPDTLFDSVKSMGGNASSVVRFIVIPGNLPALLTSLRVSLGTSIAVLFLAETFASTDGLGWYIMDAWARVDYPDMYAAMICLSALGLALFLTIDAVEAIACRWRENA